MPFKIIIASVLKPVDDTRMFEKLGVSINNIPEFDANIVGFLGKSVIVAKQYPIFRFNRKSLIRIIAPLKFLRFVYLHKPDIIIAETYELLLPSLIYKTFGSKCKIIYDIRENYRLNAKNSPTENSLTKWIASKIIGSIEDFSADFIDQFFIAEKIYDGQLTFLKTKRPIVLENRAISSHLAKVKRDSNQILFTGTLGFQTCVLECIELTEMLHEQNNSIKLTIIGYAPDTKFYKIIKEKIAAKPFIELVGGNVLVPHQEILVNIRTAGFGFIGYEEKQHILNKIPTKYFEYVENELPIILFGTEWLKERIEKSGFGICINSVDEIGWYSDFTSRIAGEITRKEKTWELYNPIIKGALHKLAE